MDRPKLLALTEALEARKSQTNDTHVFPLTNFVRRLRAKMGPHAQIPFFDPWDGGTRAEALFLLEAPGPKARNSGFISMNNPDETAKNFFEISREAKINRKKIVVWNVVPWYIGSGVRIRPANSSDIEQGKESLAELIDLLPLLRVIVLVGGKAQKAADHVHELAPHLRIFRCPHPSPMFVNRKPENRQILLGRFREIQRYLGESVQYET